MSNLESKTLEAVSEELMKNSAVMKDIYSTQKKVQQKSLDAMLKDSKLNEKMLILIQEQSTAEGKYKQTVEKLINDLSKEQNLSNDQMNELNTLLGESKKIQDISRKELKQDRKRQAKENPLTAFSQAMDDFKETKSVKESGKTLLSGLKEGFTFKNITKGLLHGAGIGLDLPALNILASEISTSVEQDDELNKQQKELLDKLGESESTKEFGEVVASNRELIDEMKDTIEKDGISADNADKLIDTLENIENELHAQTVISKEQLFMQKDLANDAKVRATQMDTKTESGAITSSRQTSAEEDDGDTTIFGVPGFGGKDSKKSSNSKSKFARLRGMSKSLGALSTKILRLAGPVGLAIGAVTSIYDGFQGFLDTSKNFDLAKDQIATSTQKFASTVGSILESLSFGLLDEKETAKDIDKVARKVRGVQDDGTSIEVVDGLAKDGIITKGGFASKSKITNWDEIEKLPRAKVRAVYDYANWSTEDRGKLIDILNKKDNEIKPKASVDLPPPEFSKVMNVNASPLAGPVQNTPQIQQPNITVQPTPVVVQPAKTSESRLNNYSLSDDIDTTILTGGNSAL